MWKITKIYITLTVIIFCNNNCKSIVLKSDFCNNFNLNFVNLDGGYTLLKGMTFLGCKNITIVHLCESLEYVEKGAFKGCKQLLCVTCPSMLKDVLYDSGVSWAAISYKKCPNYYLPWKEAMEFFSII